MIRPIREIANDPDAVAGILTVAIILFWVSVILSAIVFGAWKLFWWLYA